MTDRSRTQLAGIALETHCHGSVLTTHEVLRVAHRAERFEPASRDDEIEGNRFCRALASATRATRRSGGGGASACLQQVVEFA